MLTETELSSSRLLDLLLAVVRWLGRSGRACVSARPVRGTQLYTKNFSTQENGALATASDSLDSRPRAVKNEDVPRSCPSIAASSLRPNRSVSADLGHSSASQGRLGHRFLQVRTGGRCGPAFLSCGLWAGAVWIVKMRCMALRILGCKPCNPCCCVHRPGPCQHE